MKVYKLIYWIATALITSTLLISSVMYFIRYDNQVLEFEELSFPTWMVYPLAICKFAAAVVILSNKGGVLKEWAYAGVTITVSLAFLAHFMNGDGKEIGTFTALLLVFISYFLGKKVRPQL